MILFICRDMSMNRNSHTMGRIIILLHLYKYVKKTSGKVIIPKLLSNPCDYPFKKYHYYLLKLPGIVRAFVCFS